MRNILVEALEYVQDAASVARLHFTVAVPHQPAIQTYLDRVRHRYAQQGAYLDISYSVQKPATDTIAVDSDNIPVRDSGGALVFRPGGHGALLENLADLHGDIIFIKNIDNVLPDRLKPDTYRYKKLLCGYLLHLQQQHSFISPNSKPPGQMRRTARVSLLRPPGPLLRTSCHLSCRQTLRGRLSQASVLSSLSNLIGRCVCAGW